MKIIVKYYEKNIDSNTLKNDNYVAIYVGGIKVKKIKVERKVHTGKNSKKNTNLNTIFMIVKQILKSLENKELVNIVSKFLRSIKVKKLDMDLGINFQEPIINAYCITIINSVLPTLMASNPNNFNLNEIRYTTFVSDKTIDLKIYSIISISIVKNITSIIKIISVILKGGIKNGKQTSNRISNDNINDLNRKYGRC